MRLLQRLHELQHAHGYLTPELLGELSEEQRVPLFHLQGLVSFYPHFRTAPPPRYDVAVCRDMSCWLAGAPEVYTRWRDEAAVIPGCAIRECSCLGRCDRAPAAAVNGQAVSIKDSPSLSECLDSIPTVSACQTRTWRIDPYRDASERYGLLRDLIIQDRATVSERIIHALKQSGLRGMGGAGFPTGAKWEVVQREARTPKYVIANADESEPGSFKDRMILAQLPHLVIEGMIVAGLATGAEHGILFIRHEYESERQAFADELKPARELGLLGTSVLGSDRNFDIEIVVSPGGYILGEETALLEALEDKRGEPRNKPPYPGTHGLYGLPTLINNVETLAVVPSIVRRGADWWRALGKPGFAGLKMIALSGQIERPGVYEIPVGTTVRELMALGGGVQGGLSLKAFAPGGASSNFLPASQIDVPLDFDTLAKAGSMLGSGAVIVVAEGTDMLPLATNVVRFFRNESCGKCVPCRVGSQKAVELLERVQENRSTRRELKVLPELGETMALTSICGLGQVALNPILSAMAHWPEETRNG